MPAVAAILPWVQEHWFDFVQSLGIVASVALTAASLRRESRGRRMADHLTLVAQHRELWIDVSRRPELGRILQAEVDLVERPISMVEEDYLNLVIVHYTTGWLMAREGGLVNLKVLAGDARAFFSLPIPKTVWEQTAPLLDPAFVAFIRSSLGDLSPTRLAGLKRACERVYQSARQAVRRRGPRAVRIAASVRRSVARSWTSAKRELLRLVQLARSKFAL